MKALSLKSIYIKKKAPVWCGYNPHRNSINHYLENISTAL